MNLKQRRKLLCLAAASGSVPNLEVAVRAAGCLPTAQVLGAAAAAGSLEACQWLHLQGYPMGDYGPLSGGLVLAAAARGGHMHVCVWLLTLNLIWWWGAEEAAAKGGHVDLMELLIQRRPQLRYVWPPDDMSQKQQLAAALAKGCNLPTLQRLWPRWGELLDNGYKATVLAAAAGSPTPDWAAKVEWLEGQGCPRTEDAAEKAAARPDALERLVWLRGRGFPLETGAVKASAANGNTAALHYLVANGARPALDAFQAIHSAAVGGQLPALQALHAAGWPFGAYGSHACWAAAGAGHLHVVAWLVEALGVALTSGMLTTAAESGSVELMAWLREHGCEWSAEAFSRAARSGCEEALEWLAAQGCPVPEDGGPYMSVIRNGDLATARCLRRLGVPWGDPGALVSDAMCDEIAPRMLRWLLEAGCPLDADAAEAVLAGAGSDAAADGLHAAAEAAEELQLLRQHRQQR